YYFDCRFPIRLCYTGNTFRNNLSYHGRLSERTELGAELINDDSPQGDAECIVMLIDCFLAAGLKDFQVEIGQAEFYKGIMDGIELDEESKAQIHEYIENKNSLGLEMFLEDLEIPDGYRNILLEYNELYGDISMLAHARELTNDERCLDAIKRLELVYEAICQYGYEKYISFDLGMVNHFDYYTGIIFSGYTYGTGDAIGKGGRYDNLLNQFGKNAPACGFTILVDDLLSALSRQNIPISLKDYEYSVLVSTEEDRKDAIRLVTDFRKCGQKTEWMSMATGEDFPDYVEYAISQGAQVIYCLDKGQITIYDNKGKVIKKQGLNEFRREN
ncbi:MAG: ATP phosphoribosyltransferase regulatory subunit, partial [Eubacterium sp.]|nr:ATP phosphoribosyltransferase regulatory subunit [Eubacterium sp.]